MTTTATVITPAFMRKLVQRLRDSSDSAESMARHYRMEGCSNSARTYEAEAAALEHVADTLEELLDECTGKAS